MDNKKKLTWEQFKEDLLVWKNGHTEEYNSFARQMQSCDATGLILFYNEIVRVLPTLNIQWKEVWDSEDVTKLDNVIMSIQKSGLPENLIAEYDKDKDKPVDERASFLHSFKNFIRWIFCKKPVPVINLSAPLVLSWLVFGKGFETMYDTVCSQMGLAGLEYMDKDHCLYVGETIVRSSIRNRYRTREDWDSYFRRRKAMGSGSYEMDDRIMEEMEKELSSPESLKEAPSDKVSEYLNADVSKVIEAPKVPGRRKSETKLLVEYLKCGNKDKILEIIRNFIKENNTSNGLAMPYFVLIELNLFTRLINRTEYSVAITRQYEDIEGLKSMNSCRQALGSLRKPQYVLIKGKQRNATLIESAEIAQKLEKLKSDIKSALGLTTDSNADEKTSTKDDGK